ncbi:S2-RNase [Pyrus ussuriensis x Pyrus communis]|uniref:S2-RNase n=1 Tax=Pyrus ussuriensis x Pyrus communis TaxID=2448454 RepID=A0A5N5GEV3_9ROSA|nr:S2-RNase [Pyrus ussuriensis x Pyrus communis]
MADSGGPPSKTIQGEGSEKDKKKKRDVTFVRYTSSAKSRYQITYAELAGYEKSDMANKFRGNVVVLVCDKCRLMKLMEALKKGYKQWRYDVERNEGPVKQ